ncbi:MAG: hypothetical protein ACRDRO_23470 [Pseudonocardiaceae bacterium]
MTDYSYDNRTPAEIEQDRGRAESDYVACRGAPDPSGGHCCGWCGGDPLPDGEPCPTIELGHEPVGELAEELRAHYISALHG